MVTSKNQLFLGSALLIALFFAPATPASAENACHIGSLRSTTGLGGIGLAQMSTTRFSNQNLGPEILTGSREYLWEDNYVQKIKGVFSGIYMPYDRLNKYSPPAWPMPLSSVSSGTLLNREKNFDNWLMYDGKNWVGVVADKNGNPTPSSSLALRYPRDIFYLGSASNPGTADFRYPAGGFCYAGGQVVGYKDATKLQQNCAAVPGAFLVQPVDVGSKEIQRVLFCQGLAPYIHSLNYDGIGTDCKQETGGYTPYTGTGARFLSVNLDNLGVTPLDAARVGTENDPSKYAHQKDSSAYIKDVSDWLANMRRWANQNNICSTGNIHYRDNSANTPNAYSDYATVASNLDIVLDESGFYRDPLGADGKPVLPCNPKLTLVNSIAASDACHNASLSSIPLSPSCAWTRKMAALRNVAKSRGLVLLEKTVCQNEASFYENSSPVVSKSGIVTPAAGSLVRAGTISRSLANYFLISEPKTYIAINAADDWGYFVDIPAYSYLRSLDKMNRPDSDMVPLGNYSFERSFAKSAYIAVLNPTNSADTISLPAGSWVDIVSCTKLRPSSGSMYSLSPGEGYVLSQTIPPYCAGKIAQN